MPGAARPSSTASAGKLQAGRPRPGPGFDQALFDDPTCFAGNVDGRKQFRRWAGDRFGEWYERGREARRGRRGAQAGVFESDWWPDGPHDYFAQKRVDAMFKVIRRTADEVRLETTRELLGTVFALGDGAETTWAAATVDQHEQRIGMLARTPPG